MSENPAKFFLMQFCKQSCYLKKGLALLSDALSVYPVILPIVLLA